MIERFCNECGDIYKGNNIHFCSFFCFITWEHKHFIAYYCNNYNEGARNHYDNYPTEKRVIEPTTYVKPMIERRIKNDNNSKRINSAS